MTRLRAADPAREDNALAPADESIWAALDRRSHRRPARGWRLALVALGVTVAALAFGLGRGGSGGPDFNAAARAYAALNRGPAVYHFFAISRLELDPDSESYTLRFMYPSALLRPVGGTAYEEYWMTTDGERVRGVQYSGADRAGGAIRSFVAKAPVHEPGYIRPPGARDPLHAFRDAYRGKLLHSRGATNLGGVPAWRFTAKHGRHGLSEEWIVDQKRWLPLRYRYVDHNRQGDEPITNRLTIRFPEFEVLPLNATTEKLFAHR
jgi:hypothetical protein